MKHSKVSILFATVLFFVMMPTHAISEHTEETINEFMMLRMNLSLCENPNEALDKINSFEKEHSLTDCTAEEIIILENFYELERYNYLQKIENDAPETVQKMKMQLDKNIKWMNENKNSVSDKWLLTTFGDLISVSMSFDPIKMALKYGLSVKKLYEQAIEQDATFSYALLNLAQWYYYAPGISGGSKIKAKSLFETSLKNAKNDAERYFAKIFLSQVAFDEKNKDLAEKLLAEADSYVPGGAYVSEIREINKSGISLFAQHMKKAK